MVSLDVNLGWKPANQCRPKWKAKVPLLMSTMRRLSDIVSNQKVYGISYAGWFAPLLFPCKTQLQELVENPIRVR